MLCVAAEIEYAHGKKRPLDRSVTGILRKLVAAAEEPKRRARSGVVAPLRRRAGKLFTHVFDVLRAGKADRRPRVLSVLHCIPFGPVSKPKT
jgi:hypothetical protein